ncbi:hypothetical protein AAVH_06826 [Aphelenchoides avenae]|nr:hypothetical protein AAVH_06826 [Aphelenchus avenae]
MDFRPLYGLFSTLYKRQQIVPEDALGILHRRVATSTSDTRVHRTREKRQPGHSEPRELPNHSRRLSNIQRLRQELLPTQPLAATSAATAAATDAGPSNSTATNRAAARQRLSQTLNRLVNAEPTQQRQPVPTTGTLGIVRTDSDPQRFAPEERAEAENLWNSISPEPQIWTWPAPATDSGFEPQHAHVRRAPAGHSGYAFTHAQPLTGWEPQLERARQHPQPHLSLQDCTTDYEKLFNGDERLNRRVAGQLPITSLERLFFAWWATRYHLLPKRNPNNHFEVQRPNESTAAFLGALLTSPYLLIPDVVNNAFDNVVAGTPAPHFKAGDLQITLLRWYESCPASRQFLHNRISGPARMDLPTLDLYRPDIRKQLDDLFREHFAAALGTLRFRVYNVRADLKPMWRIPRDLRQLPIHEQDDPSVWCIRPNRILDYENVIFADSWGLHFGAHGSAVTIILSGPPDHAIKSMRKFFLSHRVQNVYWFWGRDGLSEAGHEMTENWYTRLTDHFVGWFPHVRLFVLMPPYNREYDHYWSHNINRGVLADLREYCLNATVICDPLDLKLHDYHEQYILNGSWQDGYPPWPTDELDAEGTPSVDGIRRRKAYMKEQFGIALWNYAVDDSMDIDPQAARQEDASPGHSGSSTASPTLHLPGSAELRRQPEGTTRIDAGREPLPNVLYQLDAVPHTPTWLTIYPGLSHVEALNIQGAYKHLVYSTAPEQPDSDADSDSSTGVNPIPGHPSVATAAGGRRPSGQPIDNTRDTGQGHSSGATAAEDRSLPGTSDIIRTRTTPTEQRRGTPRASSRRPTAPRDDIPLWFGEARRGQD